MAVAGDREGRGAELITAFIPDRAGDDYGSAGQVGNGNAHDEAAAVVEREHDIGWELRLQVDRAFGIGPVRRRVPEDCEAAQRSGTEHLGPSHGGRGELLSEGDRRAHVGLSVASTEEAVSSCRLPPWVTASGRVMGLPSSP